MLTALRNLFLSDPRLCGVPRSPQWSAVRALHLKDHPTCEACGCNTDLEVHHVVPFSQDKTKELDPTNLITLCERNACPCHYVFGHFGISWSVWNVYVRQHARQHLQAIQELK